MLADLQFSEYGMINLGAEMSLMHLNTNIRQTQKLSLKLQHAVQLLQMSSLDFAAIVRSKLNENPFLEEEEQGEDGEIITSQSGDSGALLCESTPDNTVLEDRDFSIYDGNTGKRHSEEDDVRAMELMASPTTLSMYLHGQINLLPLSRRDSFIAKAIIDSIDDDGYLRTSILDIADFLNLSPTPQIEELMTALHLVQSLEPIGVGARSVSECLTLQCQSIDDISIKNMAVKIINKYLDSLVARDISRLKTLIGEPTTLIEDAVDAIRRLDPRPGWKISSPRVDYIIPDVIVRKQKDKWVVRLNPAVIPRLRINKVYEELFLRQHRKEHPQLTQDLQDARWTLSNVAQRFSTILDIAEAIVRKQALFLEFGAMAMKPLLLKEIANEVGVHESTVSRATNNKYIATPIGIFELRYFFSRSIVSASGAACSPTAIRELMSELIATESPKIPMSDGEITIKLAEQGINVARRTVTKYRQLLQIESANRRVRHAS